MQEIFNFVVQHWQVILSVVLFVASLVVAIVRKKPINSYLAFLFDCCVQSINLVEKLCKLEAPELKGQDKLDLCVDYVLGCLKEAYPGIEASRYKSIVIKTIENILDTPQKKGGK